MESIPWHLLPIIGPTGFALTTILLVILGVYRALETGRLQTSGQVDTQLGSKDNVISLLQEALEHERAAREKLQEVAEFTADTVTALRAAVDKWE